MIEATQFTIDEQTATVLRPEITSRPETEISLDRIRLTVHRSLSAVQETWRAFEEFNLSPPLALEALFVRRDVFARCGGYRNWSVMEDLEILPRLRRYGRLALLDAAVITSARRHRTAVTSVGQLVAGN